MQNRARTGTWSRLVGPLGPGSSTLVLTAAASSAVLVAAATMRRAGAGWAAAGRCAAMGAVAFDLCGGLVAFHLPPTRQRYAESSLLSRLGFALVHLQPFLLPVLGEGSWPRAAARYATAVTATAVLETFVPRWSGRPVLATGVAAAASIADLATGATGPSAQRWFGPVYLLKVIGGHAGIRRI